MKIDEENEICEECGHVFSVPKQHKIRHVECELQEIKVIKNFEPGALVVHKPSGEKWYAGSIHPKYFRDYDEFYKNKWDKSMELNVNLYKYQHQALKAGSGGFSFPEVYAMDIAKEQMVCSIDDIDISQYKKQQQSGAHDLETLRKLGKQRGYKPGWAERVYQARLAKRHG